MNTVSLACLTYTQMRAGIQTHANTMFYFKIISDSCQLTLDPNTANRYLRLSEGNRKVTRSENAESYLHHPDRFNLYCQLLCKEA
jgi:hypothetical protein